MFSVFNIIHFIKIGKDSDRLINLNHQQVKEKSKISLQNVLILFKFLMRQVWLMADHDLAFPVILYHPKNKSNLTHQNKVFPHSFNFENSNTKYLFQNQIKVPLFTPLYNRPLACFKAWLLINVSLKATTLASPMGFVNGKVSLAVKMSSKVRWFRKSDVYYNRVNL